MIITDRFVMLNLPKTGSAFARAALKKMFEQYFRKYYPQYWFPNKKVIELKLPNIRTRNPLLKMKYIKDDHGVYSQIPDKFRDRRIMSVIRNPLDRLLSFYYYKDWQHNLLLEEEQLFNEYPEFPNLSFESFLDMHFKYGAKLFTHGIETNFIYGPQTAQFLFFFSKDPIKTFQSIDGEFSIPDLRPLLVDVDFLHTENLNIELYEYLLSLNYKEKNIRFLKEFPKRNVSNKERKVIITDEIKQIVYDKEKPLFDFFVEYLNSVKL